MNDYASDSSDDEDSVIKDRDSTKDANQLVKQVSNNATDCVVDVDVIDKVKSKSIQNSKNAPASLGDADDKKESDLNVSDKVNSKPSVDFFGLSNVESEEEPDNTESNFLSKREEMVSIHGTVIPVEIPGSQFWTDLETSELQKLQGRNIEKQRQSHEIAALRKRNFADFEHRGPVSSNFHNSRVKLKDSNQGKVTESQKNTSSFNQSTSIQQQSQPRKLYFIHPKISPLLHNRQQTCRVPSMMEWKGQGHGGAVNRVKWNVPSYSHLFLTCSMDSTIKVKVFKLCRENLSSGFLSWTLTSMHSYRI